MKILVCDDHAVFRDGLRSVLGDLGAELEVLEAEDGERGLALVAEHPDLDLVLLDLEMPGVGGEQALAQLRRDHPTTPVAIVSAEQETATMHRVIGAGASGFIPKSSKRAVLAGALQLILNGGVYIPPEMVGAPDAGEGADARRKRRVGELTARQREVLVLLAKGLTNREIGDVLDIALGTTKAHIAAILEALEVTNRTEAAMVLRDLELELELGSREA